MAESNRLSSSPVCWLLLITLGFTVVVSFSDAHVFYAGGRDGWVVDPTESYNHWAERNRFQVNDTIVFPLDDEGAGSVLLVTEQDFDACSTSNPVRRLDDDGGASAFQFDRSGSFFFISGDEDRCQKGQKLYIIVMAVRQTKPAVAPGPSSSSQAAPPPLWASAPEYAQAPGMSVLGGPGDEQVSRSSSMVAPPPTSGAATLLDGAITATVVGVLGALVTVHLN